MSTGGRPPFHWWWISSLLVAAGATASAYLFARVFTLLAPAHAAAPDICAVLFSASCDGALADGRSWILGVPLAGWGLTYFSAVAALLALARFVEGTFETHALIAASALALAGVVAGLALTLGAVLEGESICPLCLTIHGVSLLLVFSVQRAIARSLHEQLRIVRGAWTAVLRSGVPASESARLQVVGFGCVVLVAAAACQWVFVESALRRPPSTRPANRGEAIAAFVATPQQMLLVSASDPHRGPLDAPVRLVVFESLQCLHCQAFAPTLSRLEREFGDRLLVVFKHYPLSTRCNDRLSMDLQPDACEIAWAAEAAHRQARFWQFHDAMLAAGRPATAGSIEQAAHGLGLELARFEADRRSTAVQERVAADIKLGNRLKVPGTPATYLDGRLVRPPSAELLEILIRHELERNAARTTGVDRAVRKPGQPEQERRPSMDG